MKKTRLQKTADLEKLGRLVADISKGTATEMCNSIFAERDAAVRECRLRTKANALAIFKSKSNLPDDRADDLYNFIDQLLRTQEYDRRA